MKEFLRKHPFLVSLIGLSIALVVLFVPVKGIFLQAVERLILFAIMIDVMHIMGAKDSPTSMKGFKYSMRKALYVIILEVGIGILALLSAVNKNGIPEDIISRELKYLILCISIGLFEEVLFRGVVLGGLLRKMGGTQKGLIDAAVISSLIFGFLHIIFYIIGGSHNILGNVQAIMKTLQVGRRGKSCVKRYKV